MYCPECRSEYREGFTKCADCGVELVSSLPPEPEVRSADEVECVVVMRTGRIWEVELVEEALTRAGIPHFQQSENVTGLVLAKELSPGMAPGEWWSFRVPRTFLARAQGILSSLPIEITVNPDVWHFSPPKEGKAFLTRYSVVMILGFGLGLLVLLITTIMNIYDK